jgi:hypothetical protein
MITEQQKLDGLCKARFIIKEDAKQFECIEIGWDYGVDWANYQWEQRIRAVIDNEKTVFKLMDQAGDAGIVDRKIYEGKIQVLNCLIKGEK